MTFSSNKERPIRVMIVDDSTVIRSIIEKILKAEPRVEICGFATNGEQAVRMVGICKPDIIILDIEMPVMDGITAIPLLLEKKPDARIVMCSTLSERGADISIRAMSLGATDCILKPSGAGAIVQARNFHEELLQKVVALGGAAIQAASTPPQTALRKGNAELPRIVAIGSSTGGPNALGVVLQGLKNLPVPIVITQHMPPTFTRILANHLTATTGVPCQEGQNGMILEAGKAYIAPGGFHMTFQRNGSVNSIQLQDGPMENFCKPAVDPMLRSLCNLYGGQILTVILTGMGEDGLAGSRRITEAGGRVIAQDAASSVVWGMPGAVANAGLCSAVLPLVELAPHVVGLCARTQQKLTSNMEA